MAFNNRYDPTTFDDLVFADDRTEAKLRLFAEGKQYNHLILFGPYGTGKSQTAQVIARDCLGMNRNMNILIIEPDREPTEAINELHSAFKNTMQKMFGGTDQPYAIVNEIDRYPGLAQVRIRGIMDAMDSMRLGKLIMTTNHLQKVDPGIRDRSVKIEVLMPSPHAFLPVLRRICKQEGLRSNDQALLGLLYRAASIRDALVNLEQAIATSRTRRNAV